MPDRILTRQYETRFTDRVALHEPIYSYRKRPKKAAPGGAATEFSGEVWRRILGILTILYWMPSL